MRLILWALGLLLLLVLVGFVIKTLFRITVMIVALMMVGALVFGVLKVAGKLS